MSGEKPSNAEATPPGIKLPDGRVVRISALSGRIIQVDMAPGVIPTLVPVPDGAELLLHGVTIVPWAGYMPPPRTNDIPSGWHGRFTAKVRHEHGDSQVWFSADVLSLADAHWRLSHVTEETGFKPSNAAAMFEELNRRLRDVSLVPEAIQYTAELMKATAMTWYDLVGAILGQTGHLVAPITAPSGTSFLFEVDLPKERSCPPLTAEIYLLERRPV